MAGELVVLCTLPSAAVAEPIAKTLVEERLCACVNLLPGVKSVYRWQGKVVEEVEVMAILKTTRSTFDALKARLVELHPYDVPEVIAVAIAAGHQPYLDWLAASIEPRDPTEIE